VDTVLLIGAGVLCGLFLAVAHLVIVLNKKEKK